MPLAAGTQFGPYTILAPLGAGGMGEVYSARDPRLERNVAVKVLPHRLAGDADALARFEREAKAVAALSHPGILAIFDFGREGDVSYAVTELLEGETLDTRLAGGALPLRKALDLAAQIAVALAAAHSKGIVHRDLKPSNLFLTGDGRIKILDFGLARMIESPSLTSETQTLAVERHTSPGAVLGTVGYMSPEQVMGKPADTRSDIFSFGIVVFQMLSARAPFQRASDIETLHAILKDEPPELTHLQPLLPPSVQRIVRHCLEKAPDERFQSARDLAFDLESVKDLSTTSVATVRATAGSSRKWLARIAAAMALIALGATLALITLPSRSTPPLTFKRLTFNRGTVETARFIPGGRSIVYSSRLRGQPSALFSVHPDSLESRPMNLPGGSLLAVSASEELAVKLRGRVINLNVQGTLARVPMGGSGAREVHNGVIFADWSPDGKQIAILWEDPREILRVEFPPGRVLVETRNHLHGMKLSPLADRVAYLEHVAESAGGDFHVMLVDLKGNQSVLAHSAFPTGVSWSPDGTAVWFTEYDEGGYTNLLAVTPGGSSRLLWRGAGNFALQDVDRNGRALLDLQHNESGLFAMALGSSKETDLSWLDQAWIDEISADGETLLVSTFGATAVHSGAVYLVRTDGSTPVRLGPGRGHAFSPDGHWALETFSASNALRLLPTGPGEPKTIPLSGLEEWNIIWFFPEGDRMLIEGRAPGRPLRFFVTTLAGGVPRAITPEGTEAFQSQQPLSPDGKLIAAVGEDAQVRMFPVDGGPPTPVRGLSADDTVIGWTAGNKGLYVFDREQLPARVFVLDLTTGRKTLWRELTLSDPSGVVRIPNICIRPDGRAYAYGFARVLSELYLVQGLR